MKIKALEDRRQKQDSAVHEAVVAAKIQKQNMFVHEMRFSEFEINTSAFHNGKPAGVKVLKATGGIRYWCNGLNDYVSVPD